MKRYRAYVGCLALLWLGLAPAGALERSNVTYKVFQFPADQIPRIDGKTDDWQMVPEDYVVGINQMADDTGKHPAPDPKTLDVRVKVGWVKGLNRLYFLYEAYDDYWDFALPGLHNDTFELVVDGDLSGGPLIERWHPAKDRLDPWDAYLTFQGVQAQNFHIFTPAKDKDWCMAWGAAQWIKDLPYANAAYSYSFKPGEAGKLVLEFWITPFDYAGYEGPQRAVESVLRENKIVGLSWAVIDYDDVNSGDNNNGFWNLSPKHTMYGNASELLGFRLMPLEPKYRPALAARWTSQVVDLERHAVAFRDQSEGKVTGRKWDFGDGETSTEANPTHVYKEAGKFVVTLTVLGPEGESKWSKIWMWH
jgi:hypothetical protein